MSEQKNELPVVATKQSCACVETKGDEIEVTAQNPDEFAAANGALLQWCIHKIELMKQEAASLTNAYKEAVAKKWKHSTLKQHAALAEKRVTFYEKIKGALKHGYVIVPNFPVTLFAIRTDKKKPLKLIDNSRYSNKSQEADALPPQEGEYKNPFPVIFQRDIPTDKNPNAKMYWAEKWDESIDFPISMARAHIMEAVNRAMAIKIFDDFGIFPEAAKQDPIIVARIRDPRPFGWRNNRHYVSFIIAWHLDTRTI